MNWEYLPAPRSAPRLPTPDDGIVATLRPRGWLAQRWLAMLDRLPAQHQPRLTRGRSLARGGRVRDLWFAPGLAGAEVVDSEALRVSLRVRVFEESEWRTVERVLLGDLVHVAALLEGELPEALASALSAHGPALIPTGEELGGDCACGDFLLPCPHMAALHQLLADALDEDPSLILTLRGRTTEQVLARLRAAWGDDTSARSHDAPPHEAPPETGDWFSAPSPPGDLRFTLRAGAPGLGLRILGPPPGGVDLHPALDPLYAAGSEAALHAALADEAAGAPVPTPEDGWTETLVDLLASLESATSPELAARLGADRCDIDTELDELEELGIVVRTTDRAETRWWLG